MIPETSFLRDRDVCALQREERWQVVEQARRLTRMLIEEDQSLSQAPAKNSRKLQRKLAISSYFHDPLWLIAPIDFKNALMCVRPEGKRILIASGRGRTKIWDKNGMQQAQFDSDLPCGGLSKSKMEEGCVLEGVLSGEKAYVLDVISWLGERFASYDASTRFQWLRNCFRCKILSEDISFQYVEKAKAGPGQLLEWYCHPPYEPDGVLFYRQTANYSFGPASDVFLWKDHVSSKYFTEDHFAHLVYKQRGLMASKDQALIQFEDSQQHEYQPGQILKVDYSRLWGSPELGGFCSDLKVVRAASKARVVPDCLSKLQFRSLAGEGLLKVDQLLSWLKQADEL